MTKVLVDSNILIYSVDIREGQKYLQASKEILKLVERDELVVSTQNLAELSSVLLEKTDPPQNPDNVMNYIFRLHKLGSIIGYDHETVIRAISISKQSGIHFFDALLAATMQENGVSEILTEDTADFKKIKWLTARNPLKGKGD